MSEKVKEIVKKFMSVTFNLNFTTSKFLAYIIVGLGALVSLELKTESPFTIGVITSAALFGVKVWGNKIELKKNVDNQIKKEEEAI